ncbi:hypothetical protein ACIQC5_01340 [Paenarthrobacter sp. NPDC092416]|uniref:hypothetical protein n=1 Tax=Paenarthrobacter sp. NPDC092416 TaxID=3364386 RepID=UPI0037FB282A
MVMSRWIRGTAMVLGLLVVSACGNPPSTPDPESSMAIQAVIERAIDRRNHQIVAGFTSTADDISQDFVPESVAETQQEYRDLQLRRERLVVYGVGFTRSSSEIAIKELSISDDSAKAVVSEMTHLSYTPVAGVQGPDEVYVYEQNIDLAKSGTEWKIVSIAPTDPTDPPPMLPTTVIDPRSEAAPATPQQESSRGAQVFRDAEGNPAPLPEHLQDRKQVGPNGETLPK